MRYHCQKPVTGASFLSMRNFPHHLTPTALRLHGFRIFTTCKPLTCRCQSGSVSMVGLHFINHTVVDDGSMFQLMFKTHGRSAFCIRLYRRWRPEHRPCSRASCVVVNESPRSRSHCHVSLGVTRADPTVVLVTSWVAASATGPRRLVYRGEFRNAHPN